MRSCEAIYGPDQADNIEELVTAATGLDCPCKRGRTCPLACDDGRVPLAETVTPTPQDLPPVNPTAALNLKLARAVAGAGAAGT